MQKWTRDALERSFGDSYEIHVRLRRKSIPSRLSPDDAFGYVRDELGYADDVNAVCLPHCDNTGGGSACKFKVDHTDTRWTKRPDVGDVLDEDPRRVTDDTEPYDYIHSGLHEIGHCLGVGYECGFSVEGVGSFGFVESGL